MKKGTIYSHLEDEIIETYKKVGSLRKVSQKFGEDGPSHETISKILKAKNIKLRKVGSWEKLSKPKQQKLIHDYNGTNINDLCKTYNICQQTAKRILKKFNVEILPKRKYNINCNIFDTFTPESIYWLGYLYNRANIKSDYQVEFVCTNSYQKNKLIELKSFINSDHPIKEISIKKSPDKSYKQFRLIIVCKELATKLQKLGLSSVSFVKYPDFIPSNLEHHFIRGLFHARGHYNSTPNSYLYFNGNLLFLSSLSETLNSKLGTEATLVRTSEKRGNLVYNEQDSKNIMEYMGEDELIFVCYKN